MYEKGTVKLTWIDPNDYSILDSGMYNSVEEALADSKGKKNFMVFQLKERKGDTYSWQLLPYGKYNEYVGGMKLRDSKIAWILTIGILFMAGYGMYHGYKRYIKGKA